MAHVASSNKRRRDDDDEFGLDMADTPIEKKSRRSFANLNDLSLLTQPFQHNVSPSPMSAMSFGQALTPDCSDDGNSPPFPSTSHFATDTDMEIEPDIALPPLKSPISLGRPSRLNPKLFQQQDVNGGRVPTPMFNNFTAHPFRPRNDTLMEDQYDPSSPRTTSAPKMPFDRPARMPSPISEDDDTYGRGGSGGGIIVNKRRSRKGSRLSMTAEMAEDDTPQLVGTGEEEAMDMEGVELTPPAQRKGRARSGAITIEKRRFSVGFREDCEKCVLGVPGHYSHFLPV